VELRKLTKSIKYKAIELGFDLVGVTPAGPYPENQRFKEWLEKGYAGSMGWLENTKEKRVDIGQVVAGAKSVICCAINYNTDYPYSLDESHQPERGWISRYAWGDDYHDIILDMLKKLNDYCTEVMPENSSTKYYVDTGPVMEKVYAKYAGIGWIGKNTNIINQTAGSWFFLGEIITDAELEYDVPAVDRCGTCTSCIDACPTQAITEPYVLDASKCVSYLTIELKDQIPSDLREGIENNIYGCDICQDVCPWNTHAEATRDSRFMPREQLYNPGLSDLIGLSQEQFSELFRGSPIKRTKRRGLLSNILIAMGNSGSSEFIGDIKNALADPEPLIRAAAVWAYWKIDKEQAREHLLLHVKDESDNLVREEILNILD